MKTRITLAILTLALFLGATAGAQLSVEPAANPVPQGAMVKLSIEAAQTSELLRACPIDVRAGSPTGPVVYSPMMCIMLRVVIGPGQSYNNMGWNGRDNSNNLVAPGTYYIHIKHKLINSTNPWTSHFVPVRIDPTAGPTEPVLSTTSATVIGQPLNLNLNSPNNPNDSYYTAASFTTNAGFNLNANQRVALDVDLLFSLSFPNPVPGLFTNFTGTMDNMGNATPMMNIPNLPGLKGSQVAFQSIIIDASNSILISNPLTRIIT